MRYSPAGVPIVSGKLRHSSQQTEAEAERMVEFEISAIAIGEIAGRFGTTELGEVHHFTGFMARRNRNSRSLVFHITDFSSATD